ncbi:hypothetical protein Tco_1303725 [Tanacetum coccineum]
MFEDNTYKTHEVHNDLYEALQKSVELDYSNQRLADQEESRKMKRKRRESPRTPHGSPPTQPPPPPPLAGASGAPGTFRASGSSQFCHLLLFHLLVHLDLHNNKAVKLQVHLSDNEDSKNDHQPKADSRKDWWKPLPEEERPTTPEPAWTIPSSNKSDVVNNWAFALATTYEPPAENSLFAKIRDMTTFMNWYCQKTNLEGAQSRDDVNRPLPLGGPPGHVTIQTQFFFNKDLEYLRYGSKGSSPALSISKMKVDCYPNFGLELLVPEHMWIDDVCTYDISATYGISHWWFNRQKFYIDRHDSPSRRKEVRTHMQILSVIRVKAYSRYGYDYLSEIVLRRANFQEHTIAEKDFKNLYPSDFEDLNLLFLQGHLDHLPGYEFKHDYTIIEFPQAVVFLVNNNERKIMRFNEIYKFSDGMLTRILEALDYRVKEFKANEDEKDLPESGMLCWWTCS